METAGGVVAGVAVVAYNGQQPYQLLSRGDPYGVVVVVVLGSTAGVPLTAQLCAETQGDTPALGAVEVGVQEVAVPAVVVVGDTTVGVSDSAF